MAMGPAHGRRSCSRASCWRWTGSTRTAASTSGSPPCPSPQGTQCNGSALRKAAVNRFQTLATGIQA